MTSHSARLAVFLVTALVLAGCGSSPTSPSSVTPPPSPLDAAFARMCPGCVVSGAATVLTGRLSITEPGSVMVPSREVEVGTIRLTIRPLSTSFSAGTTHRVDIVATLGDRTIERPATAQASAVAGGQFLFLSATSSDPSARLCAAPGFAGVTIPSLLIWPDQSTSVSLLPEGNGYGGSMTYDTCPDNPAVLRQERFRVHIP